MFSKGQLGNLMKQAQQMQENMQRAQAQLGEAEVEGSAGGGLVRVVTNGHHEIRRITLSDAALEDRETLEDLLVVALRDAYQQATKLSEDKKAGIGAGMNLPPGMKLPF